MYVAQCIRSLSLYHSHTNTQVQTQIERSAKNGLKKKQKTEMDIGTYKIKITINLEFCGEKSFENIAAK